RFRIISFIERFGTVKIFAFREGYGKASAVFLFKVWHVEITLRIARKTCAFHQFVPTCRTIVPLCIYGCCNTRNRFTSLPVEYMKFGWAVFQQTIHMTDV